MLLHPLQTEWDADVLAADPLGFPGYRPPAEESVLTGRTRDYIQEGMLSLIQMARTAAAARSHARAGQWARHPARLTGWGWAQHLCSHWTPLHAPDPGIRAGVATLQGRRLVVIAMDRARPGPRGYRLARRAIALAGRLGLPVLTLVDTPGAEPGPEAEAGGIASEIAATLAALAPLPVPGVSVCVGDGGSGGALALAFTDRLLMLEHSVFSVISPEGAATILDRSERTAPQRAGQLKLTSGDLLSLGVIDTTIQETGTAVGKAVLRALTEARSGDRHRRFDAATAAWIR